MEIEKRVKVKHFIQYYVEVVRENETELLTLPTKDLDYDPFVVLDRDIWKVTDSIPEARTAIKVVSDTEIITDEEGNETEESVMYKYFFAVQSEAVLEDEVIEAVCTHCVYHEFGCHFRRHLCKHEEHVFKDFVSGMVILGSCRDYNAYGKCRFFKEIEKLNEDEKLPEVPVPPVDEPTDPVEPEEPVEDEVPDESGETTDDESTDDTTGID